MLTVYLRNAWLGFLRLLIPPPPTAVPQKISRKIPCPACGHVGSTLRAVTVLQAQAETPAVRATCNECGAGYDYKPLIRYTDAKAIIIPAQDKVWDALKFTGRRK